MFHPWFVKKKKVRLSYQREDGSVLVTKLQVFNAFLVVGLNTSEGVTWGVFKSEKPPLCSLNAQPKNLGHAGFKPTTDHYMVG